MIAAGSLAANDAQYHVRIGEKATWGLLDDLVCPKEQRQRDRQAQRLGGLEVDHQLELRRLLDEQVAGPGALQDLVHVDGSAKVFTAKACLRHWGRDFMTFQTVPARAPSTPRVQTGGGQRGKVLP